MLPAKQYFLAPLPFFFLITTSCSQVKAPDNKEEVIVFTATTPCNDTTKGLLRIPAGEPCEMIKWNLTIRKDSIAADARFNLVYNYGLTKQGTREVAAGGKSMTVHGKLSAGQGIPGNGKAAVYHLLTEDTGIKLFFLRPDPNILHLLDKNSRLMIGNGAWSYTLNRTKPVPLSPVKPEIQAYRKAAISSDSLVVGVFDGRMPCNPLLRELHGITGEGCQVIKCRLTLYQDIKTHEPSNFLLHTVYVGKGDTRYASTGKWRMLAGPKSDPAAIVYQLLPESKAVYSLDFIRGDDNVLFLLDKDWNLIPGNEYASHTMNRIK
jgi:hypothetical protein